jgi:hypothetical protein
MAMIEVINDAGTVLIDDNYSNACLAAKGAVTLTTLPMGNNSACYRTEITFVSAQLPMLALELNGIQVIHSFTTLSGNTWTFTLVHPKAYAGSVLNYYIFSIPSLVANAGGLVQLFNAAGQLVFDSNLKYMRVFNFYATTLANATLATNLTPGRVFAAVTVMACSYRMHIQNPIQSGLGPPYMYIDASTMSVLFRSGNSLVTQNYTTDNNNGDTDRPDWYTESVDNGRVMLIDVTNY